MRLIDEWGAGEASELLRAAEQRRAAGLPVDDLVTANPHEHGIVFPPAVLEDALRHGLRATATYRPDARGNALAREAVARWHGGVTPGEVLLTPGTSLAYWYCFRLLCEPGDDVLCPAPTYPLFDDLAMLAGARVRHYHMRPGGEGHWGIDVEEVAFQATPRTRVIVVVSPHNPTGSVASAEELRALAVFARERGIAVVLDEVFRTVLHGAGSVPRPSAFGAPLCVTLNGLSKMASLPGLKAGWMVVEGDEERRRSFLAAAEYLSDTFLPVNEAVQGALPLLMEALATEAERLAALWRARMQTCVAAWRAAGIETALPEGGVYLPVKLGTEQDAEQAALGLVRDAGVLTHPGGLYRLDGQWLVTTVANTNAGAIARVGEWLRRRD
ncbi:MAG: alanine-synthesizing transaminase [Candidatus Sumerlaeota bacterium]|nr:alanine-synthesizing transaminase [Candidatus Sumerlaeota bacterium]